MVFQKGVISTVNRSDKYIFLNFLQNPNKSSSNRLRKNKFKTIKGTKCLRGNMQNKTFTFGQDMKYT